MQRFREVPKVLGKSADNGDEVISGKTLAEFCAS